MLSFQKVTCFCLISIIIVGAIDLVSINHVLMILILHSNKFQLFVGDRHKIKSIVSLLFQCFISNFKLSHFCPQAEIRQWKIRKKHWQRRLNVLFSLLSQSQQHKSSSLTKTTELTKGKGQSNLFKHALRFHFGVPHHPTTRILSCTRRHLIKLPVDLIWSFFQIWSQRGFDFVASCDDQIQSSYEADRRPVLAQSGGGENKERKNFPP